MLMKTSIREIKILQRRIYNEVRRLIMLKKLGQTPERHEKIKFVLQYYFDDLKYRMLSKRRKRGG